MRGITLDRLLFEVHETSSRWLTLAKVEGAEVAQARRVTENDWRLTLRVPRSLAGRLEALVDAAPEAALGTCRTEGRNGRRHVQLEIGCRGPQLLANVLEAVIDHHANTHPYVRLLAKLKVDDTMRPRRIDLLVPSRPKPRGRTLTGMLELGAAQTPEPQRVEPRLPLPSRHARTKRIRQASGPRSR